MRSLNEFHKVGSESWFNVMISYGCETYGVDISRADFEDDL